MQATVITDIGKTRKRNEDSYLVDQAKGLYVVCDGMGGHKGGDVASRMAIQVISDYISKSHDRSPAELLRAAIEKANQVIYRMAQEDPSLYEMGTTVTAALVEGRDTAIAHVGDSSLFIIRDGTISKLTRDHTLAAQMVIDGLLTDEETRGSAYSHVLTRALGINPKIAIDFGFQEINEGDILLICTDGLTDMLSQQEICSIIYNYGRDINKAAQKLVKAALAKGGYDNITLILLSIN